MPEDAYVSNPFELVKLEKQVNLVSIVSSQHTPCGIEMTILIQRTWEELPYLLHISYMWSTSLFFAFSTLQQTRRYPVLFHKGGHHNSGPIQPYCAFIGRSSGLPSGAYPHSPFPLSSG